MRKRKKKRKMPAKVKAYLSELKASRKANWSKADWDWFKRQRKAK